MIGIEHAVFPGGQEMHSWLQQASAITRLTTFQRCRIFAVRSLPYGALHLDRLLEPTPLVW